MELIRVRFDGKDAGSALPTWGQQEVWGAGQPGRAITLGGVTPLPPGTTVQAVLDGLRYVIEHHQTLRTRYPVTPDGRLASQELSSTGVTELAILDAEDPTEVARRYDEHGFDCTEDWPLRMAVVRDGDQATHAVAMYNHLAVDARGLAAMLADLAAPGKITAATPLEQAGWQSSPVGRKQSDRALRHWSEVLRTVPATRFTEHATDTGYRQLVLTSPAANQAAHLLAAHSSLGTGPVLLAAFAIAVARLTGDPLTVTQVVVDNRFRAALADSVSAVSQFGLCAIDTGADFPTVLSRTWRSTVDTYRSAYHNPLDRQSLWTQVSRDRGREVKVDCFYNDRRTHRDTGAHRSTQDLRGSGGTPVEQPWPFDTPTGETLYLHLDDSPTAITFTLCANTKSIPVAAMAACLHDIESILVEAALTTIRKPTSDVGASG